MMAHEKQYSSYQDLAEAIASLPSNHDELEIVIADMIKKHIHQEKAMIYCNLQQWKDAGLEWIYNRIIDPKAESHKEFAEKWCYGTDYSVATYGKPDGPRIKTAIDKAIEDLGAEVTYEYTSSANKN